MFGKIYRIKNKLNDKMYIGQTKRSIEQRFKEHVWNKSLVGLAIIKYGAENFEVEIIEECDTQEQLDEREKFWIAFFNCMVPNGYNLTRGGRGAKGYHHTLEAKLKISEKKKGHEVSPLTRKKVSAARTGKKDSIETRKKKSAKLKGNQRRKGIPHTPEEKMKMSTAQKRCWEQRRAKKNNEQ